MNETQSRIAAAIVVGLLILLLVGAWFVISSKYG
jgi:hypothetical protein